MLMPMELHERTRILNAANQARDRVFKDSPVGELIYRELMWFLDSGYRTESDCLSNRLATEVLSLSNELSIIEGEECPCQSLRSAS